MNQVNLVGNLTADIEVKKTNGGKSYAQFTIAVEDGTDNDGKKRSQFIRCVAWEKVADNLAAYCKKGSQVAAVGRIVNSSYDDPKLEGVRRYVTDVVVNSVQFLSKKAEDKSAENIPQ